MATSIFSNMLFNHNSSSNDTDARDNSNPMISDAERQQIVALLQASAKSIEEGTCDTVIYQTMGALHQYTAMCAGLLSSTPATKAAPPEQQRPAFQDNFDTPEASDHDDALAYGWVEELSASESTVSSADVAWNSVLALLVQKEKDDEPCLWITKEVLASQEDDGDDDDDDDEYDDEYEYEDRDDIKTNRGSQASTELETLHSIPLRRRLRSACYQNFYGDHRVVLELKRFGRNTMRRNKTSQTPQSQIVLRCPSASMAKAWVECLSNTKKRKPELATHANIEVEMVDPSPSNEFSDDGSTSRRRHHIVNVIDSEDDEDDYGIPDETPLELPTSPKRLAEMLQETEDRKRAIKLAVKQAAALERAREEERRQKEQADKREAEKREQEKLAAMAKQQKEQLEWKQREEARLAAIEKNVETIAKATTTTPTTTAKPTKYKPMTAAEKQQQRMEREIAARQRAEEERRRIEIEYEQQKKERVEQRRRDLEAKRKKAREEQKRKEQLQKQKFLESEQRKEAMKAAAMKAPPKKVAKGVFSTPVAAKEAEKGNLWASLNKHMSAFETADEERKKREAEKAAEEKAKAEAEQEEDDPEVVRKRIAEEARQRLLQEEVGKRTQEASKAGVRLPEGWQASKGSTISPHTSVSPTTGHSNHKAYQNGWQKHQRSLSPHASNSPTSSQHNRTVTPPVSGNPAAPSISPPNSGPSVPPLRHPHTQSWNKIQQPPYQKQQNQQAHFQRPPPTTGGQYHSTAQSYPPQQPPQTAGSFNPMHPPQTPMPPKSQPQPAAPQPPPAATSTNDEFSGSTLKKNVLIQWGLQPPSMQVLKPVDQLLCSIHGVFPPSFGVPSHEYFTSWKPIARSELINANGILEEAKLKKMVRRVRFFLHPDKLPHDLSEEQGFLCKLLWDVINDAFEEYKKSKEDLDWM